MKRTLISCALTAASIYLNMLPISAARAEPWPLGDAQSAVLQTDGPRATKVFKQLLEAPASLSLWDQRRARCSIARLAGKPSIPPAAFSGDKLADRIVGIYRAYWQAAMNPSFRVRAEDQLFSQLRGALRRSDLTDREAIMSELSKQLTAKNIYTAALGKTASLYDIIVYLQEEDKPYNVRLTDGTTQDVNVFLMRTMVSSGWSRYFNCGGPGIGGFAVDNGLYAIAETYDLNDEGFLVSFLSHETRHFADYKRFPDLEGPELEYRAKLTELALVDKTLPKVLGLFQGDQSDDRENPHSYANKRVLADLRSRLGLSPGADLKQAEPTRLREAARALLVADNAARESVKR